MADPPGTLKQQFDAAKEKATKDHPADSDKAREQANNDIKEIAETAVADTLGASSHTSSDVLRPAVVAAADLRPPGVLEVQGVEVPIDGSLVHASLKNIVDWCAVPAFADSWVNQPERCRETTVKILPLDSTKKYSIRDVFSAFGNQWTSINGAVAVGANPSARKKNPTSLRAFGGSAVNLKDGGSLMARGLNALSPEWLACRLTADPFENDTWSDSNSRIFRAEWLEQRKLPGEEALYSLATPGHLLSPHLFLNCRHIIEYLLYVRPHQINVLICRNYYGLPGPLRVQKFLYVWAF